MYQISRAFFSPTTLGQVGRAPAGVDRADLGPDLAENRLVRSDGHVAQRGDHVAATDGVALDARDHRLGHVADNAVQFLDRQPRGAAAVVLARMRRLVAARTERAVAGAGDHDGGDLLVPAGLHHRVQHFLDRLAAKCIHHVWSVDGDVGDLVALFVDDVLVAHE
jgi:hypothetical protein